MIRKVAGLYCIFEAFYQTYIAIQYGTPGNIILGSILALIGVVWLTPLFPYVDNGGNE